MLRILDNNPINPNPMEKTINYLKSLIDYDWVDRGTCESTVLMINELDPTFKPVKTEGFEYESFHWELEKDGVLFDVHNSILTDKGLL